MSVILPFLGDDAQADRALTALKGLETKPGDELILADNNPDARIFKRPGKPVTVVDASDRQSASHARNVAGGAARGEWLLFLDGDCMPPPDLLDRYFDREPGPRCAVVAGEIVGAPGQAALLARWARSRRGLWVSHHQQPDTLPAGVTANMLVRRVAWEELGGFRIGGGGDLDLSWRAQKAGWTLEYRPDVVVEHLDRESFRELLEQAVSYGSHHRRLRELHGSFAAKPKLISPLARAIGGAVARGARGQLTEARFKLIDALWAVPFWWGDRNAGRNARRAD